MNNQMNADAAADARTLHLAQASNRAVVRHLGDGEKQMPVAIDDVVQACERLLGGYLVQVPAEERGDILDRLVDGVFRRTEELDNVPLLS